MKTFKAFKTFEEFVADLEAQKLEEASETPEIEPEEAPESIPEDQEPSEG